MTTITMKEVAAFLLGEASLDGYWFGERHPISPFWWREHLRASQPATAPDEQIRKDAERYRWCVKNNLVLAGGTREFGWQIAPVGSEWNRFIDAAMKGTP